MINNESHYAIYANNSYRDPLEVYDLTEYTNPSHRDFNLRGDPVFQAYINEIDKKIFSELPLFNIDFTPFLDEWNLESFSSLFTAIADNARMQDFIIVQLYEDDPYWRIFTPDNVKELNKDAKGNYTGAKVVWYELDSPIISKGITNMYEQDLIIGDEYSCWIFSFNSGKHTGKIGYADISQALWTLVIMLRKIRTQLDLASAKPEFKQFVFGQEANSEDINAIVKEADYLNISNAIGAKKGILDEIRTISITNGQFMLNALTSKYKEIALVTNLPASFFMGEREAGAGNAGNNVTADSVEVERKKESIFDKIKPLLIKIVNARWGLMVTDAQMGKTINPSGDNVNTDNLEEKGNDDKNDPRINQKTEPSTD